MGETAYTFGAKAAESLNLFGSADVACLSAALGTEHSKVINWRQPSSCLLQDFVRQNSLIAGSSVQTTKHYEWMLQPSTVQDGFELISGIAGAAKDINALSPSFGFLDSSAKTAKVLSGIISPSLEPINWLKTECEVLSGIISPSFDFSALTKSTQTAFTFGAQAIEPIRIFDNIIVEQNVIAKRMIEPLLSLGTTPNWIEENLIGTVQSIAAKQESLAGRAVFADVGKLLQPWLDPVPHQWIQAPQRKWQVYEPKPAPEPPAEQSQVVQRPDSDWQATITGWITTGTTSRRQIMQLLLELNSGSQDLPTWEFVERFATDYQANRWQFANIEDFALTYGIKSRTTATLYFKMYEAGTDVCVRPGQGRSKWHEGKGKQNRRKKS